MADPVSIAAASLVVGAIGTGYQIQQGQEAAKARKNQAAAAKRQRDLEAARERRRLVNQGIISRASQEAQAVNAGLVGSSFLSGATTSLGSDVGGELSYFQQTGAIVNDIENAKLAENKANFGAQIGAGVQSFAGIGLQASSLFQGKSGTPA